MIMLKHTIAALAVMGAGLAGFTATGASAFPVQPAPAIDSANSTLLTDVRTSHYNRNRVYNRHYDGMRCNSWNNRCRYRHGGYYYENPWWTLPLVGAAGVAIGAGIAGGYDRYDGGGYGNRHVQWCLDRYRSYNPRTNTWVSYSGRVNQCISPY
jgi:hypothetical protein